MLTYNEEERSRRKMTYTKNTTLCFKIRRDKLDIVAFGYNPSCSGSEGKKTASLRTAQAMLMRTYIKNKTQIKGLGAWLKW
jgi:hypothetical protein